jgi:hypothetical protein
MLYFPYDDDAYYYRPPYDDWRDEMAAGTSRRYASEGPALRRRGPAPAYWQPAEDGADRLLKGAPVRLPRGPLVDGRLRPAETLAKVSVGLVF